MKKALYLTAATAIVCSAFAGGIYASAIKTDTQRQLDACAQKYDVYQCIMVPMPAKDYAVVKVSPDLLPPPVEME
jgi:hypothetical protein